MKHWLWPKKKMTPLEAWIAILLLVNHTDEKVLLGNQLFVCKRGESLKSLDTWAQIFRWSKSGTLRFIKLLESDKMLERKPNRYTTHLIVCNYESYQGMWNADESQTDFKRNASETEVKPNKELKQLKNDKNIPSKPEFLAYAKTISIYHPSFDFQINTKYDTWKDNGWKDGNDNPIKNWQNKLRSTMPYMKRDDSISNQQTMSFDYDPTA